VSEQERRRWRDGVGSEREHHDGEKVDVSGEDPVVQYLGKQFPRTQINRYVVPLQDGREYQILADNGHPRHRVLVANEFLDDHAPEEAARLLAEWNLAGVLTAAGNIRMVVTNQGIREQPRT
jgi:hypothetical protein